MRHSILRSGYLAMLHDICMAALSFFLALYLRLGDWMIVFHAPYTLIGVALFVLTAGITFSSMRLYRGMWHFASMEDLSAITRAVSLTVLVFAFIMFSFSRLDGFPRSALIINWLLLIFMLGAPRFAYRMIKDRGFKFAFKRDDTTIPVILYGAGNNAELFVRDCLRSQRSLYHVTAIIDPDPEHKNRTLHGVRIYYSELPFVLRKLARNHIKPQRLIIADDLHSDQLQTLMEQSDALGLTLSRLPRIDDLQRENSALHTSQVLKPIDIEDLLGRAQSTRNVELMQAFVQNKTILITGAGGSIGSELVRQLAKLNPAALLLLDQSEFALYTIDKQIKGLFPNLLHSLLIDVRDKTAVDTCIKTHQPDIIFHAAAIKHVPLSEDNPIAAIHTNVIGTRNVLEAAKAHGVASMVTVSTDKAVHPTNVMGASKRLAEKVFLAKHTSQTSTIAVRFGNVLGSAGSVVPLFQEQLARGGPITVTHEDMTRYFMTIREAVDLVIHAASLAASKREAQALYVLDMGTPIKITTLAQQMIRLSGLSTDDIPITYTGLRPGEKLYEELFYTEESPQPTELASILKANHLPAAAEDFTFHINQLEEACRTHQQHAALGGLKNLVSEYKY